MDIANTTREVPNISHNLLFEGIADEDILEAYRIYYIIIESVIIIPTVFGNAMVLIALWRFSGLRKNTSYILIGNLAVSDLLVGAVVFPVHMLVLIRPDLKRHMQLCLLHYCLVYTFIGTSVLNLFLLSLERFHAIKKPLTHSACFTKRTTYFLIAFIWLFMIVFGFLPMVGWHKKVDHSTFMCKTTQLLSVVYTRSICTLIVLSMLFSALFFFVIIQVALKAASSFTDLSITEEQQQRTKRNIRHTKMMSVVSGLFIVFWAPFCILALIPNQSDMLKLVTSFTGSFGVINSCLNWMVYGIKSKRFRIAFKAIVTCRCKEANQEISQLST